MKIELECLNCIFKQILEISRMCTDDENKIRRVLNNYARLIPTFDLEQSSPAISEGIFNMVKEELNNEDPYQEFKEKHINLAQELYPIAKNLIEESKDKIHTSLVLAATGNSIDSSINLDINVKEAIKDGIEKGFTINDFNLFKENLNDAQRILIIGDNSGEGVFDKLLINELKNYNVEVTYAVRSIPILNDITIKEAEQIGLDKVTKIIESGCSAPGMVFERTNNKFKEIFEDANIIISKGQGNYEGLSELNFNKSIFYLLKAKCNVIANEFEIPRDSLIFKKAN